MDIGTWGRWCFWGLWLFGLGFSFLGGGKRSFCGTFHRLSTRLHRSDIQLRPQWREVIHKPQFSISVFPIFAELSSSSAPVVRHQLHQRSAPSPSLPESSVQQLILQQGQRTPSSTAVQLEDGTSICHCQLGMGQESRQLTPNSQYLFGSQNLNLEPPVESCSSFNFDSSPAGLTGGWLSPFLPHLAGSGLQGGSQSHRLLWPKSRTYAGEGGASNGHYGHHGLLFLVVFALKFVPGLSNGLSNCAWLSARAGISMTVRIQT